jgi:hypothetical protein
MKAKQQLTITLITVLFAGAMLFTSSTLFAQVKIGTNPTTINPVNNLEVEASTAGRVTSVNKTTGQVTIKDGTEGLSKVLTSDASGAANWQTPAAQNAEVMFSAKLNLNQVLPALAYTKVNFNTELFDKGNNFDLTADQLTAPTSGYYTVNVGFSRSGSLQNSIAGYLYTNNVESGEGNLWDDFIGIGNGYTVSATRLIHLNAGDLLDFRLRPNFVNDGVYLAFFQIAKVSN